MEHLRRIFHFTVDASRPAQPAADRPRGLERLPESQLLLQDARRDASRRRRISKVRRGRICCLSRACSSAYGPDYAGALPPLRSGTRKPRPSLGTDAADGYRPCSNIRLGRRMVPARLRRRSATRSARTSATRDRFTLSRRASCVMAGIGREGRAGRRSALDSVREKLLDTSYGVAILYAALHALSP